MSNQFSAEIVSLREYRERRFRGGPPRRSKLEIKAFAAFEDDPRDPPRPAA